jgi:hypothetical protein
MGDDSQSLLEIYLSTNLPKRECAMVSKLAAQLLEALNVDSVDILSGVFQLLLVPHFALDEFLMENGVTGRTTSRSETTGSGIPDEAIWDDQISDIVQPEVEDLNSSTHSRLSSNSVAQTSESTSTVSSTDSSTDSSEEVRAQLLRTRNQVSVLRASTSLDQVRVPSEVQMARNSLEEPSETVPLEPVTTAEIYNTFNRDRNINRLRDFARNTETVSSVRGQRNRRRTSGSGLAFDLSELELALQEIDLTLSTVTPMAVRPNHRRILGISDRTPDQKARDFEVGFLGEYFVSPSIHYRFNAKC